MCIPNQKLCSHGGQLGGPTNSTSSTPRHEMLHALEGLKKCHLYIVKNCAFLDNSDDDMYEQVGYIAKFLLIIQKMATSFAC